MISTCFVKLLRGMDKPPCCQPLWDPVAPAPDQAATITATVNQPSSCRGLAVCAISGTAFCILGTSIGASSEHQVSSSYPKGGGYGHGVVTAAKAFLEGGFTEVGTGTLNEALALRRNGVTAPVHLCYQPDIQSAPAVAHASDLQVSLQPLSPTYCLKPQS